MGYAKNRVCPVEMAHSLDNRIRGWLQNPKKILGPYIKEGMTVLDLGCGPGFFTLEMARMVGQSGRVIAADIQEGMLQKLKEKIQGTELEKRITLHRCEKNRIGITDTVNIVLAFYMVHEVTDKKILFEEISRILEPGGQMFISEPPFHVSQKAFAKMIQIAKNAGFTDTRSARVLFSKTVILKRG